VSIVAAPVTVGGIDRLLRSGQHCHNDAGVGRCHFADTDRQRCVGDGDPRHGASAARREREGGDLADQPAELEDVGRRPAGARRGPVGSQRH